MSKRPNRTTDKATPVADQVRTTAPPSIDDRPAEAIDPAHRPVVEEGMAEARRGAFAGDAAVEALYRRAGL
jgi:hypothetical protein